MAESRTVTRVRVPEVGRRILEVARTVDLTPRLRRIVLTGAALDDGFPWQHFAVTDHVKVVVPDPATGEIALPVATDAGLRMPNGAVPLVRDYTVRAWDPQTRELTLDFVLHDHGPAGKWASSARPGDRIGAMGPRGNVMFPTGYPFYLALGDETAIPAVTRLLEELPDGARVLAFLEVEDATEELPLTLRDGVEVRWVHRAVEGPGGLERALRAWTPPADDDWFAFAAGEAGALVPVRRYLRHELGLPKEQVDVDGYWKIGVADLDHHADHVGSD
ncbi:Siderophore-interacting protein [Xylanimonas cellulosilytica DSM 15894]|uniref:Siderophore-interacting protein n=1 Tax=Xylanimonas cellulosilytica (strain DSM 15894 / JCM 12276 / CECT 5975 / KCTC 9989 / LMG 20990 / NBRC 107835 / XIL07) TaxID=446471 RepID=D1BRZ1_XYLCX|nr:siderophore-interacting protein [Xylanimonas cellulosilytica]ACZ30483.1 Siderophore-interacting protein [Xylanimonas cellulosilytica DSM 15894]